MESAQLGGKSVASQLPPKNPYSGTSTCDKPCKVREEGELTSSSEEAPPTSPGAPSTGTSIAVSSFVSKTNATSNVDTQSLKSGALLSGKCQTGYVDIQSRVTSPPVGQKRNSQKCKVPLKSSRSVWKASQGNNLIISFSDDSGSDSESQRPQSALAMSGANTNWSKKPTPPPAVRMLSAQQPLRKDRRVFTKKVSIGQGYASSVLRSSAPKARTVRSSSLEPRNCPSHSNSAGKIASQDLVHHKGDLSDSKLQDLRQQIAMRENELKLKAAQTVQPNEENFSDCYKEFSDLKHNSTTTRIRPIYSDSQLEQKEPAAKKVKLASNNSDQLYPSVQDETSLKFIVPSDELVIKSKDNNVATAVNPQVKEYTDSNPLLKSFGMHQQERQCLSSLTAPKSRNDNCFTGSCTQPDLISTPGSISHMSKPTALSATVSPDKPSEPPSADRLNANDRFCSVLSQAKPGEDATKNSDQQDAMLGCNNYKPESHVQVNPVQDLVSHPDSDSMLLSLIEAEEMHDKLLEEAQEHRHRCEIEERNALRAYRKAQRALARADAQCSYSYRIRELFSARVRSFMMEDSNLYSSSNQHEQFGPSWNFSGNISGDNVDPRTKLVGEMCSGLDAGNQICYDSHIQIAEAETQNRNSPNSRLNLGAELLSEPDTSTSELLPHKDKAPYVLSPSNDPNVSSDEYEQTFLREQQSGNSSMFQKDNSQQRKTETIIDNSAPEFSISHEESVKLEAQLRSKLFSRLRMSTSLTKSGWGGNNIEKVSEVDAVSGKQKMLTPTSLNEHHDESHDHCAGSAGDHMIWVDEKDGVGDNNIRTQFIANSTLHSNQRQNGISELGGLDDNSTSTITLGSEALSLSLSKIQQVQQKSKNHCPGITDIIEDCRSPSTGGSNYLSSASIIRSAFHQMKISYPRILNHAQNSNQCGSTSCRDHDDMTLCDETGGAWLIGGIDSYSCNSVIDPLWPLCMHELRGKCNDEDCPYQHARDFSSMSVQQDNGTTDAGSQAGLAAMSRKLNGGKCVSLMSTPPAYLVGFDNLEFDSQHCDPLISQTFRPRSTGNFSISLAVSSSLLKNISSDEPVLLYNQGCVDARGSYQKSLYIQTRSDSMAGPKDSTQFLETALTIFCPDVDRSEGKKKSLSTLTRALEDDPTCPHIWIVYLLIYYSDKYKEEDEDFFSCAVKHNEGSYELWLLYTNSRGHLKDQYAAYERSISSLCRESPCGYVGHRSDFVLDLFLQMLHSCTISGNAGKAVQRIYGLTTTENDPDSVLLSDILQCLVISDKYVFWVCCVYLVIYRKLPDAVVQRFEFEKDITLIDWPHVKIKEEQKDLVSKLIDMALDNSIAPADLASLDDKTAVEAAQHFALSHIKIVGAIDGFERSKKLLEKYTHQFPTCLELVLLLARLRSNDDSGQRNFSGFEEALTKWPKEVPGIQCIWNQYVEYALRSGGHDVAKNVLVRWSDSVAKDPDPKSVFGLFASVKLDLIYGLLNLSLYWVMQDNVVRAQVAIGEAMKIGEVEDLDLIQQCIREHAVFLLNYGTQEFSTSEMVDLLSGFMDSSHLPLKEPLTRKFIQQIQKPRVRQFVEGILCPLSPDFSIPNLILESWFGPSLLPQTFEKTKDLVDLVESVLDISPANYPLAISACKILLQRLSKVDNGVSTSFWASSILVSTMFRRVPVPPEYVWVEASGLLGMLKEGAGDAVLDRFYHKALSVYPFSAELWKSYVDSLGDENRRASLIEAAREKGIEL